MADRFFRRDVVHKTGVGSQGGSKSVVVGRGFALDPTKASTDGTAALAGSPVPDPPPPPRLAAAAIRSWRVTIPNGPAGVFQARSAEQAYQAFLTANGIVLQEQVCEILDVS